MERPGLRQRLLAWPPRRWVSDGRRRAPARGAGPRRRTAAAAHPSRRLPTAAIGSTCRCHFQASIAERDRTKRFERLDAQRASLAEQIQRAGRRGCCCVSWRISGGPLAATACALAADSSTTATSRRCWRSRVCTRRRSCSANPGNAGVAVGAALSIGDAESLPRAAGAVVAVSRTGVQSPGDQGGPGQLQAVVRHLRNGQIIERTAAALAKGQMVGLVSGPDGVGGPRARQPQHPGESGRAVRPREPQRVSEAA